MDQTDKTNKQTDANPGFEPVIISPQSASQASPPDPVTPQPHLATPPPDQSLSPSPESTPVASSIEPTVITPSGEVVSPPVVIPPSAHPSPSPVEPSMAADGPASLPTPTALTQKGDKKHIKKLVLTVGNRFKGLTRKKQLLVGAMVLVVIISIGSVAGGGHFVREHMPTALGGISADQQGGSKVASGGTVTGGSGGAAGNNDLERKTDVNALEALLEEYFAEHGNYPTFTNVNNPSWRATAYPTMDPELLRDPQGTSYTLADSPTPHTYSYHVRAADGSSCDDVKAACTQYLLTAILDNGSQYVKDSTSSTN